MSLRSARGQSLVEVLVSMAALVPLLFAVVWIAKVHDLRHATLSAARELAFECTVRIEDCGSDAGRARIETDIRHRHFAGSVDAVRTLESAAQDEAGTPPFWRDRRGEPLLDRRTDVETSISVLRFDSPLAFAASQGNRVVPDAVRTLSDLAGPGRFGLAIDGGLLRASVRTGIARSRPADGWMRELVAMPLTVRGQLALLTDGWDASGPYGSASDTVETRVSAGAALPVVEPVIEAGWLPVRGLLAVAAALGLESGAARLRWRSVDVDLIPPDRSGIDPGAPPPPSGPSVAEQP